MDDAKLKRLVIILIVSIAIILLFKYMLTKSYSILNAAKKPESKNPIPAVQVLQDVTQPAASATIAASAVVDSAASSVASSPNQ